MVTIQIDGIYAERILVEIASLLSREEEIQDQFHAHRAHAIGCLLGEIIPPVQNNPSDWRDDVLLEIHDAMTETDFAAWRQVIFIMERTCGDLKKLCSYSDS